MVEWHGMCVCKARERLGSTTDTWNRMWMQHQIELNKVKRVQETDERNETLGYPEGIWFLPSSQADHQFLKTHFNNALVILTLHPLATPRAAFPPRVCRKLILFPSIWIVQSQCLITIRKVISSCAHKTMERATL